MSSSFDGCDIRVFAIAGLQRLERFLLEVPTLTWGTEHDGKYGATLERKAEVLFVTAATSGAECRFFVTVSFREWDKKTKDPRDLHRDFEGSSFRDAGIFDFLPR